MKNHPKIIQSLKQIQVDDGANPSGAPGTSRPKTLRPWASKGHTSTKNDEEWLWPIWPAIGWCWDMLRYVEICWVSNVFLWVLVIFCSKLIGLGHLNLGFRWCQARSVGKTWLVRNGQFVKKYVIQQVLELDLWMPLKFVKLKTWRILENTCRFLLISVDFGTLGTLGTLHGLPGSPRVSPGLAFGRSWRVPAADGSAGHQGLQRWTCHDCHGEQCREV